MELAVEAAGARIGVEKAKILTITANLDMNGEGKQGFEMGPGIGLDVPLNLNRGARARAAAGLPRPVPDTWRCRRRCEPNRDRVARLTRARQVL